MTSISDNTKRRGRPKTTGKGTLVGVRMLPDDLALLDRFIAEQQPDMSRPEALRHAFREWMERGASLAHGATEAEMVASAVEVRSQAADAADEAMSGMDVTNEEKATRRGVLTDEPAVVAKARGKGRSHRGNPEGAN